MIKKIALVSLIGVLSQTPTYAASVTTGVVTAIAGCALGDASGSFGVGNSFSEFLFKVNGAWFRVAQRTYDGTGANTFKESPVAPFEKVILLSYMLSKPLEVRYTFSRSNECGRQIEGYAYFDVGNGVVLE